MASVSAASGLSFTGVWQSPHNLGSKIREIRSRASRNSGLLSSRQGNNGHCIES